jgi:hypothetical protein
MKGTPMNKRVTAIGLTAGLLAGAGAGLILEMSGSAGAASNAVVVTVAPDDTATTDDTNTSTDDTNTSTDAVDPAADRTARLTEVLQPLVDNGTLTQDQMTKVIAALDAAGPVGGPGMGGGHGGRGGMGRGLDTVATALGLTADEVRTAIEGGQTIAQLAEANGTSAQSVIDALVAEVTAHLDEEVAAGEHTQADADARIAEATTRITEFVNNTQTAGPGGPGMGGPGMGGPGMGGPGMGGRHGHDGDVDGDDDGDASGTAGTNGTIDGGPSDTTATAGA